MAKTLAWLLVSSATAAPWRWTHLSRHTRAIKYAPRLYGVSPAVDSADLFHDKHAEYFERDSSVLQGLGASTLLLEPQDVRLPPRYLQALFNATNFIFDPDVVATVPSRVTSAVPLEVVPGFDFSQAPTSALSDEVLCGHLRGHAQLLVAPQPNASTRADGLLFGGGARASKDNLIAFQLVPECSASAFEMLNELAGCVREAAPPHVRILVGLRDSPSCDVVDVLEEHATVDRLNVTIDQPNVTDPFGNVDGFVVQLARTHGCDATARAEAIGRAARAARQSTRNPLPAPPPPPYSLWFVVGVDAFDSSLGGEYATVRTSSRGVADTLLTVSDARTDCLLALIDSIDDGSRSCAAGDCAVVVHEYADSFFRASVGWAPSGAEPSSAAAFVPWSCEAAVDGASGSYERQLQIRGKQLSCGVYAPCEGTGCRRPAPRNGSFLINATDLPVGLSCNPHISILAADASPLSVPPCHPRSMLRVDSYHQPAWDGLMRVLPDGQVGSCSMRFSPENSSLIPRRAFYMLQREWYPLTNASQGRSIFFDIQRPLANGVATRWMWGPVVEYTIAQEEKELLFWEAPAFQLTFWAVAALLLFVSIRGLIIAVAGKQQSGRTSTLVWLGILAGIDTFLPGIVLPGLLSSTVVELFYVALFLLLWCPLNGGGSRGDWWWVHFGMLGTFFGFQERSSGIKGLVSYVFELMLTLLSDVIAGGAVEPSPVTPFWDVCSAAQCCVRGREGEFYLPWRSNVTAPTWWEPFLGWEDIFVMIGVAFGAVLGGLLTLCTGLQLSWLMSEGGKQRHRAFRVHRAQKASTKGSGKGSGKQRNSNRARTQPNGESLSDSSSPSGAMGADERDSAVLVTSGGLHIVRPDRTLGGAAEAFEGKFEGDEGEDADEEAALGVAEMRRDVVQAREALEEHYGHHFQTSAMDACVAQVLGFVDSRARRIHGYQAAGGAGAASPSDGAAAEDAERRSLVRPCAALAVDCLLPPRSMPLRDADALWKQLMECVSKWMSTADFRACGRGVKGPNGFAAVQRLLREHGEDLKRSFEELHTSSTAHGPSTQHWQMLLLYLLMGADNVLRTAPEAVCLLFTAYACEFKFALARRGPRLPPGVSPKRSAGSEGAASLRSSGVSPGSPSERALHVNDLDDFRTSMYELLRFAGGKLGNRVPDLMRERYMNFDDLSELSLQPDATALFNGLSALQGLLKAETAVLLKTGDAFLSALSDGDSELVVSWTTLDAALKLCDRISARAAGHADSQSAPRKAIVAPNTGRARRYPGQHEIAPRSISVSPGPGPFQSFLLGSRGTSGSGNGVRDTRGLSMASEAGLGGGRLSVAYNVDNDDIRKAMLELQRALMSPLQRMSEIDEGTAHEIVQVTDLQLLEAALTQLLDNLALFDSADVVEETVISLIGIQAAAELTAKAKAVRDFVASLVENSQRHTVEMPRPASNADLGDMGMSPKRASLGGIAPKRASAAADYNDEEESVDDGWQRVLAQASVRELSRLHSKTVGVYARLFEHNKSAGALYVEQITDAKRFTWGRDEHKTFEERPGYDCVALNLWFLFRFLWLALMAVLFHASGGLFARYWQSFCAGATSWSGPVLEPLFAGMHEMLGSDPKYAMGLAPMWVASYASLAIVHHLIGLAEDVLWLNRALTTDTAKQHDHWTKWTGVAARWSSRLSSSTSALNRYHQFSGSKSAAVASEMHRLVVGPLLGFLRAISTVVTSSGMKIASIRTYRMHAAFSPTVKVLAVYMRLLWLVLLMSSFGSIGSSTSARVAFAALVAVQAWVSVFASIVEALFSRIAPTDRLLGGRVRADTLFGWYFDWWELGHSAWKPREHRPLKDMVNGSLFWVLTFTLKISVEYTAASTMVLSASTFLIVVKTMSAQGAPLYALAAAIGFVLRLGFTLLFFLADLQLFFAASMAIVGGLTVAKTADCGALGSLWDRSEGLGERHWLEAASGVVRRFPAAIRQELQEKGSDTGDSLGLESQLLQRLWNFGLLPDLQKSHLIDAKAAKMLRIQAGISGRPMFPSLATLMPSLCEDARRRIHTFISFCSRGAAARSLPIAGLPSHSPSLTALVPVYGETVIRSWHEMFHAHSGGLCNLEFMVETRLPEFRCLLESLPPYERRLLERFLDLDEAGNAVALADTKGLRDDLWYSDHLLILLTTRSRFAATIAANAQREAGRAPADDPGAKMVAQAERIASLVLRLGTANDEFRPSAAEWGSATGGVAGAQQGAEELLARQRLLEHAASLGVVELDAVVTRLYTRNEAAASASGVHRGGFAWVDTNDTIRALQPEMAETSRYRALADLGLKDGTEWSASAANALIAEVYRTASEAQLKLKLRLWFSCREQTVWRTLSGLMKAEPALEMMQRIGASKLRQAAAHAEISGVDPEAGARRESMRAESMRVGSLRENTSYNDFSSSGARGGDGSGEGGEGGEAEEAEGALPRGLMTVMAALQNYAGWRKKQAELEKKTSDEAAKWLADPSNTALAESLHKKLYGAEQLASTFDQCASVALLHRTFRAIRVVMLESKAEETFSVLLSGSKVESERLLRPAAPLCELMLDPLGSLVEQRCERRITLMGQPIADALAEGKPVNQANALLHCHSEIVMVNDMNQGADFEQLIFLPSLLAEFHTDGRGHHAPDKRMRIVGFKEYIFTEDSGIVGRSGALNEFTFGTIIQRELHVTLGARLHYGHPDCFDFGFVLTQGGTSKMSKTINVSEDIFGGINVVMRGGAVSYVDYLQVDKGRDVQYDAALAFEGKICGGTSVHTLSRDFFRLMHSPFTFFHKLSLLSGGFGYFWSNLTLVLAILTLAAMHAVIAMLPSEIQFVLYADLPSYIPLLNLGFIYLFALIVQYVGDRGIKHTLLAVSAILASIPLTLAKMKMHQYYGHRGLGLGLAKYVGTGRDLATKRVTFIATFQRYLYSHLGPGLDMLALVLVTMRYNTLGDTFYINATLSLWVIMFSWLFAPAIYNPFAFNLTAIKRDYTEWSEWVRSAKFESHFFGQEAGQVQAGDFSQNNWFSWLNAEPFVLKLLHASARFLIYGVIGVSIVQRIVYVPDFQRYEVSTGQHQLFQVLMALLMIGLIIAASRVKPAVLKLALFYFVLFVGGAAVFVTEPDLVDTPFQLLLCLYCLGKAGAAMLELAVLAWASGPAASGSVGGRTVSSRARLLSPRRCPLLASRLVLGIARTQADTLALVYFGLSAAVAGVLAIPLSVAVAVLVAVALMLLTGRLSYSFNTAPSLPMNGLSETLTSATGESVVLTTVVLATVILAHGALGGQWPRERSRFTYAKMRFVWQTLNLNALHNWLLMNVKVARFLAEKAAVHEQAEAPARAQYYALNVHANPLYGGATRGSTASPPPPGAAPLPPPGFSIVQPQPRRPEPTGGVQLAPLSGPGVRSPPPTDPSAKKRVSTSM